MFKIDLNTVKKNVELVSEFRTENGFKKVGKSIPQQFCALLDSNPELIGVELDEKLIQSFIMVLNFSNYFSNEVPAEIVESLDFAGLQKYIEDNRPNLKPTNDNMSIKDRLKAWSDRAKPYFKSHIVGTSDKNSLNVDERFKYKTVYNENAGLVTFKLKNEPKTKK